MCWTLHIGEGMVNLRRFKFLCNWVAWKLIEYHESYSEDHDGFHMPTSSWSILMIGVCLIFFHAIDSLSLLLQNV